jgi:hypothetical protein
MYSRVTCPRPCCNIMGEESSNAGWLGMWSCTCLPVQHLLGLWVLFTVLMCGWRRDALTGKSMQDPGSTSISHTLREE